MIVRNEQAIIERCLLAVTPYIDCYIICDTGSSDDTVNVIKRFFDARGIPGEIPTTTFQNFGQARNEALDTARSSSMEFDYLLFCDADMELMVINPDFKARLTAPAYLMPQRNPESSLQYFNLRLVHRSVKSHYQGVTHEYLDIHGAAQDRLLDAWYLDHAAGANRVNKYERDIQLLSKALRTDKSNARNVFYLAQSYRDAGQLRQALSAYDQRAAMFGYDQETFCAQLEAARVARRLKRPAAEIMDRLLRAYESRPQRAESLGELAVYLRQEGQRWPLARMYARQGMEIPHTKDSLFVEPSWYLWRCKDECSVAAFWMSDFRESFDLCVELLRSSNLPDTERPRVQANRDFSVPQILDRTASYPTELIRELTEHVKNGTTDVEVTLTITSCKRLELFERTMNSFLRCCLDHKRIGRWICIDDNSSQTDRERMQTLYPFFEFIFKGPDEKGHAVSMNMIRERVNSPWWLHMEDDWHFFLPNDYVGNAITVLEELPSVGQVLFNRNYAETLEDPSVVGSNKVESTRIGNVRYRHHHYVVADALAAYLKTLPTGSLTNAGWPHYSLRPSLLRTSALLALGPFTLDLGLHRTESAHFEREFGVRYVAAGLSSVFFDEIGSLHTGRLTSQRNQPGAPANAYDLNRTP